MYQLVTNDSDRSILLLFMLLLMLLVVIVIDVVIVFIYIVVLIIVVVFIFSQILTEYVVIEPRVSVRVCVNSTAHTDGSISMKLSTNDLEDICQ